MENSSIGTAVGITASATDTDLGDSVTYSLSDDAAGLFSIHETSGVVTVKGSLDYELAPSQAITILARSSDGSVSSKSLTIEILDNPDEHDISQISDIDDPNSYPQVYENSPIGTVVGITAFATDADEKDAVKYSLSHDADGLFSIDEYSGIVSVNGALDYAGDKSLDITVLATSTDASTASRFFKIFILDDTSDNISSSIVIQNQTKFLKTHQLARQRDYDVCNYRKTW